MWVAEEKQNIFTRKKIFCSTRNSGDEISQEIQLPGKIADAVRRLNDHANLYEFQIKFGDREHKIFSEILAHHPRAAEKIGPGVSHFFRSPNPYTGWNIIRFRRTDLSEDDLDTRLAIGAMRNPDAGWVKLSAFTKAARNAVADQIENTRISARKSALKNNQPGMFKCAVTGEYIDERNSHVDHDIIPFSIILASWVIRNKINPHNLKTESIFPQPGRQFISQEIKKSWADFHHEYAILKIISKDIHKKTHYNKRALSLEFLLGNSDPLPPYLKKIKRDIQSNVIPISEFRRISFRDFTLKAATSLSP